MDKITRTVDVLLFDDVNLLDVAGPVQTFCSLNDEGEARYVLRYVSIDGAGVRTTSGLRLGVDGVASLASDAQDLLIPGGRGVDRVMGCALTRKLVGDGPKVGMIIVLYQSVPGRLSLLTLVYWMGLRPRRIGIALQRQRRNFRK